MDQEPERIFAAFDVSNIWKACAQEFGPAARVDWQTLCETMRGKRYPAPVRQRATAYIVTDPRQKHHALAESLRYFGYNVRERYMAFHKGMKKPLHTDWDVGITIDAMAHIDNYDTFVLVSGDGDFGLLLEHLKAQGKKTVVLTFATAASKILYEVADELHIMHKESVIYSEESSGKK
jgi:uncharacterized LabA/DUF88 family protein